MGFDISKFAEQLGAVSESDTGREKLLYIDIGLLDNDPDNFYEMSGLADLASNIQVCGLQQPIRVRKGEDGRYTIVSGHRRRAALQLLVGEGLEQFRQAPCLLEAETVSPAMRELRLIFANSGTRKLSSADLMKQAERTEMLLYQLKAEGYEFPGRMRDQVAAACQVSATKLAVLKVIREKLQEPFVGQFRAGELTEQAAYALARLPEDIQKDVALAVGGKTRIKGTGAEGLLKMAAKYYDFCAKENCQTDIGSPCGNLLGFLRKTAKTEYSWDYCEARCCCVCHKKSSCPGACKEAKKEAAIEKENEKLRKAREEERREAEQVKFRASNAHIAKRLLRAVEAAGLRDSDKIRIGFSLRPVKDLRAYADQKTKDHFYTSDCVTPASSDYVKDLAKQLGCSADFILGLSDDLTPAPQPEGQLVFAGWMPGGTTPREPCDVVARFDLGDEKKHSMLCRWSGAAFVARSGEALAMDPIKWMALPPDEEEVVE